MFNKIFFVILCYLTLNKFNYFFKSRKFKQIKNSFDFKKFNFDDENSIKKILFAKKFFEKKIYDERSYHYHNFNWIYTAKNLGGSEIISITKDHICNWYNKNYKFLSYPWESDMIAKRIINLLYYFDFFAVTSTSQQKNIFNKIILQNYFALLVYLKTDKKILNRSIEIFKAILLVELIQNLNPNKSIAYLKQHIQLHINKQGMHRSMNPCMQAEYINNLFEIKSIFLFFNIKLPDEIDFQILNMTAVLSNFFHPDGTIAFFNGSNNAYNRSIKKIIQLSGDIKHKDLSKIENGIAVYSYKKMKIFFDAAKFDDKLINKNMHAGTLGFEMSLNNEKIITNCGSIEKRIGKKPEYFRYSAAHSTITLNNTNISELVEKKSYKRTPKKISLLAEEDENFFIWSSSHDGYLNNFKKIVKRQIKVSKKDLTLFGKDSIISMKLDNNNTFINIRFHLTPDCTTLLTNNKQAVLIKTKLKHSYVFKSDHKLLLTESIYISTGNKIEKTKQIIVSSFSSSSKKNINWSISAVAK